MHHSSERAVPRGSSANYGARFFLRSAALLFLASAATAQAAERSVLTLGETLTLASQNQPQVEALTLQQQAALEAAQAEKALPDPKLAFGVQNLPATGDQAFRFNQDEMTMVSIGLMQDIVTRDKREAASARMSAEAARLAAERSVSERVIRRQAALAWLDAFEAQRRAATLRELAAEMTAERGVGAGRLSSAETGAAEILRIDAELSATRDEQIVAARDEARARAALSRWIGEAALRPLPERLPASLGEPVNAAAADPVLDAHPAIESVAQVIATALHEVDLARAERRPDWGWQLMYGQREDGRSDMVSFQVTVGLPWNRAGRQDRRIAQKLAEASAARSEMSDRRRMLEAELASVRADLDATAARLREHEQGLVPVTRARIDSAQAAYAGGNGSLLDVWQARRAWLAAMLHHEMILTERARALTQLAWLTGQEGIAP